MSPIVFLILTIGGVSSRDFALEALKNGIDWNADPCDNFYRHVCPLHKPKLPRYDEKAINEDVDGYWKYLEIAADFRASWAPQEVIEEITGFYETLCENGGNTTAYLLQLETITTKNKHFCEGGYCLLHLKDDPNCKRAAEHLKNKILKYFEVEETFDKSYDFYSSWLNNAVDIAVFEKNQLQEGFRETGEILEAMKDVAHEWITQTPWANNNEVTKLILSVLESTVLRYPDMNENKKETFNILVSMNTAYKQCKELFENSPDANIFCFYMTGVHHASKYESAKYFNREDNAYNMYPTLAFGLPHYYEMQHTEEMAIKLGDAGCVIGHELGHSIIAGKGDQLLTYFSNNSADCVFQQYNASCIEFKEISCSTNDGQLDENGADIIGNQLAYHLLEEYYGPYIHDIYEPLNVTYQQLFFYSNVLGFCDPHETQTRIREGREDEHALPNVRVNAMSQLPAFQEAFKCSDDSRMMRSARDECIIYGEQAPAVRRKR